MYSNIVSLGSLLFICEATTSADVVLHARMYNMTGVGSFINSCINYCEVTRVLPMLRANREVENSLIKTNGLPGYPYKNASI